VKAMKLKGTLKMPWKRELTIFRELRTSKNKLTGTRLTLIVLKINCMNLTECII
jgi:hypothetical protein